MACSRSYWLLRVQWVGALSRIHFSLARVLFRTYLGIQLSVDHQATNQPLHLRYTYCENELYIFVQLLRLSTRRVVVF
jgi:hypothetical protein